MLEEVQGAHGGYRLVGVKEVKGSQGHSRLGRKQRPCCLSHSKYILETTRSMATQTTCLGAGFHGKSL